MWGSGECTIVSRVQTTFQSLALDAGLVSVVSDLGYLEPTPVQSASIPILLAGQDLIGQSKTGSGKTAAFALPILQRLELEPKSLQALVLCPTRELCAQVAREVRRLGRGHAGLVVLEIVGGQPGRLQRESLDRGVHIAIATPGRLLDHLQRDQIDTSTIQTVVLDEADRMLDMGFGEDVGKILGALPSSRQTALFSATFPDAIESISKRYQRTPVRIAIESPNEELDAIAQFQLVVKPSDKVHGLCWVLNKFPSDRALVFCNFKATVAELTRELARAGLSVDRLDGDLDQFHRDQVLARFRNQSVRVLVATDVAGRGIDVRDLDVVINYELPQQPEIYVHRIGRTGRAGDAGTAISITTHDSDRHLAAAEELTGKKIEKLSRGEDNDPGFASLLKSLAKTPKMETILISGGRKDKVRPGDILGALTGDAGGLKGADVGKIEVQDRLSYVAVLTSVAGAAVKCLNKGRIKGKRFRATVVDVGH